MQEKKLECCHKEIKNGFLWFLKDRGDLAQRKLYLGKCSVCGDWAVLMISFNTKKKKLYFDNFTGIEAVKAIYRAKKEVVTVVPDIKANDLYGWVYGVNKQIVNKKGEVTQIRQYASDFSGRKNLVKKIINR